MKSIVFLLFAFWLLGEVAAQNITNVDFQQEGDEIVITYDLDKRVSIEVSVSLDGRASYGQIHSVRGDVGSAVFPGKKRIVWNVLQDFPEGIAGQILFKVSVCGFTERVNGVEFEMVYAQGGTFKMGATAEQGDDAKGDEKPVHQVTLSDYYIGRVEVTQELWEVVMGTTIHEQRIKAGYADTYGVGPKYPMYYISWDEAQEFCMKLSQMTGKKYALPTEAQWEYVARGGNKNEGTKYSGSASVDAVAWYNGNSGYTTHPVGQKLSNELDIYDMSGNVWEWCSDWYGPYSKDSQTNPTGFSSEFCRVLRGGSWNNFAGSCRVVF